MKPRTPIEEARHRRGAHPEWPRMYWAAAYRGDRHRLDDHPTTVTLDLSPGQASEETAATLNALLRGFIVGANIHRPNEIRACYLELRQQTATGGEAWPGTGQPDLVWRVTWDPERE